MIDLYWNSLSEIYVNIFPQWNQSKVLVCKVYQEYTQTHTHTHAYTQGTLRCDDSTTHKSNMPYIMNYNIIKGDFRQWKYTDTVQCKNLMEYMRGFVKHSCVVNCKNIMSIQ